MKGKKLIIGAVAIVIAIAAMLSIYFIFSAKTTKGSKSITVEVVYRDKSTKEFQHRSDAEYLGQVLTEEKLVEGKDGGFGMYITSVDGEAADDTKQEWWCITKGGEMVNTSADMTPIADGEHYELTFTEGF